MSQLEAALKLLIPEARKRDLPLFVDKNTWLSLSSEAQTARLAGEEILIPRPEHLIALKLHSAKSPHRLNAEQDWEDIRQIIRCCHLDPHEADFQKLVVRFGDESALQRILNFPV